MSNVTRRVITKKIKSAPKRLFLAAVLLAMAGILAWWPSHSEPVCSQSYRADLRDVRLIPGRQDAFRVEVLKTSAEREHGLSGRACIDDKTAMLFTFEQPGNWGFWMKDMKFDIDIIWLNANKSIVHIEKRVPANSYPKIYYPNGQASYVLEMHSGRSDSLSLKDGQTLNW